MNPADGTTVIHFDTLDKFRHPSLRTSSWGVILVVVFFGMLAVLFAASLTHGGAKSLAVFSVILAIIAVSIMAVIVNHKIVKRNQMTLAAFASTNDMTYQPKDKNIAAVGALFEPGYDKTRLNVLSGVLRGMPFSSYEYFYTTGSGKNQRTYDAMVLEVTLPRVLPQFVIDSQLEDVIPLVFDKSQKIELEGDFHKYFDLYAPDTYGVSALTLLAPDAMETLMEQAALCDIEVVQNKLFFYWPVPAGNRQQYEQLFMTAQAVLDKLGTKLTKDNIYGTIAQAQIHSQPSAGGVRLRRSRFGMVAILAVCMYIALQFMEYTSFSRLSGLLVIAFCVVFVFWGVLTFFRQAKLKREYLSRYKAKY